MAGSEILEKFKRPIQGFYWAIRDIYFKLEDKYYDLLDRINEKIPIYRIIDPIDRIMPSFLLFLIIIVLLVFVLLFMLISPAGLIPITEKATLFVTVLDGENNALEGASVTIELPERILTFQTDKNGNTEKIELSPNTKISIFVTKDGYLDRNKTVVVEAGPNNPVIKLKRAFKEISITILDEDGELLTQDVRLDFDCSNPEAEDPPTKIVSGGEAVIEIPYNCGQLIVDAFSVGFKPLANEVVTDGSQLMMEREEPEEPVEPPVEASGTIIVDLLFNGSPVEEAVTVNLYKDEGADGVFVDSKVTSNGRVEFEVVPGTYFVKTNATRRFDSARSDVIYLENEAIERVTLYLKEKILGQIKIKVLDKETSLPVDKARVSLRKGEQELEFRITSKERGGLVEFNIKEDIEYSIVVDHNDYCVDKFKARIAEEPIVVKLKRFAGDCGGVLRVRVVDQDGRPVPNAKVSIYTEEGFHAGYIDAVADDNGTVVFNGIESGNYKIFAYKGTASGWSDVFYFSRREGEAVEQIVTLQVGSGSISVKVIDPEGNPVPFALIAFKDAVTGKTLAGPMPADNNGMLTYTLKEGGLVYLLIKSEEYATYVSAPLRVIASTTHELVARLDYKQPGENIKVEFLGLYKDVEQAETLAPDEEYVARFKLVVPEDANFDTAGFHIRTGEENSKIELDKWYIKRANVAMNISREEGEARADFSRGTSFFPSRGEAFDSKHISMDGAKWMQFEWETPVNGTIYLEFTIKVKDTAREGERLELHWRAWATKQGRIVRDPQDVRLPSTKSGKELYAKTYVAWFTVGKQNLCTDKWCFAATLLDLTEQVEKSVYKTITITVGKPYRLKFTILNNGRYEHMVYSQARLRVVNKDRGITITAYEVNPPRKPTVSATDLDVYETPEIELGTIERMDALHASVDLLPKIPGTRSLRITIKTPKGKVFERELTAETLATNDFNIMFKVGEDFIYEPPTLASGIENKVIVKLLNATSGEEVEGASVKALNKFGDVLASTTSNRYGIAEIKLPPFKPGERVWIKVEKPDYNPASVELRVDSNVIALEPSSLSFSLNPKQSPTDSQQLTIKNLTKMTLTLKQITVTGEFKGYIDLQKASSWLTSEYYGKTIGPGESLTVTIRLSLSDYGMRAFQPETLEGKVNVVVAASNGSWGDSVNTTVAIGVGGEVDDASCLAVSPTSWTTATQGQEVSIDVEIQNNCTIDGKPTTLKQLSARVEWKSNDIGDFYLKSETSSIELRSGYGRIVLGEMGPEQALRTTLSFKPDGGINGTAEATIIFSAFNPTDSGKQELTTSIEVQIKIVNLEDCVSFNQDLIKIPPGEEGSFTIKTENCGRDLSFKFKTELALDQKFVKMKETDSKEIRILSSDYIPGQYPIFVLMEDLQGNYKLKKLIRVIIEAEGCLELTRYEYDVYDDPANPNDGFDVGKLINKCYAQDVQVKIEFDTHDWKKAMKTGLIWALVGFVYGGIRALMKHGIGGGGSSSSPGSPSEVEAPPAPEEICAQAEDGPFDYCEKGTYCIGEKKEVKEEGQSVECCTDACVSKDELVECKQNEYCDGTIVKAKQKSLCYGVCVTAEALCENAGLVARSACENNECARPGSLPEDISSEFVPDSRGIVKLPTEKGDVECCQRCASDVTGMGVPSQPTEEPSRDEMLERCAPNTYCYGSVVEQDGAELCSGECLTAEEVCKRQGYAYCSEGTICIGSTETVYGVTCCVEGVCSIEVSKEGEEGGGAGGAFLFGSEEGAASIGGLLSNIDTLLGIDNPLQGALVGFIAGTLFAYNQQKKWEYNGPIRADDLVVDSIKLLMPNLKQEQESTDIVLTIGEKRIENSTFSELGQLETELIFENVAGVKQEDAFTPIYRILKVSGTRYTFKQNYKEKEEKDIDTYPLEVKETKPYEQKFRLQFNAWMPEEIPPQVLPGESCAFGGKTGKEALPRVKFVWDWSSVSEDMCDEDGQGYYCDATQFSIELLKKINKIEQLLSGQQLRCPSAESRLSTKTQPLGDSGDVGIIKIQVLKSSNQATVVLTVGNSNNAELEFDADIVIAHESGQTIRCPDGTVSGTVAPNGDSEAACTFSNLDNGNYNVSASVKLKQDSCPTCTNSDSTNDSISTSFLIGPASSVFEVCRPYSTARIEEFLEANPNNPALQEVAKLVNFKAFLIQDGYTLDFRRDFHKFAVTNSFFDAPSYYLNEQTGLSVYFKDPELFTFSSPFLRGEYGYLPAGKYAVRINITYNNDSWSLFNGSTPDANIVIELERLGTPEPDSPFYYMPFDGLVGNDFEGRLGYGVNYKEDSEDVIYINNDERQPVMTSSIANSTPAFGAWVRSRLVENFRALNNIKRGMILDVERNPSSQEIVLKLRPSIPTPVILKVDGGKTDRAYAFYSLTIDGETQKFGNELAVWNGIGENCRDFTDAEITSAFRNTPDIHGGTGKTMCSGARRNYEYGIEWCNVRRKGSVFLETVFFTPQNASHATLEITRAVDDAIFISPGARGKKIELTGMGLAKIRSVEDTFKLVEQGLACVTTNSARTQIYWNPKEVAELGLKDVKDAVPEMCIQPYQGG
jgi:hypothetical protein